MVSFLSIRDWILQRKADSGLVVTQLTWPGSWGLDFYDFQVTWTFNGKECVGRGIDSNAELALTKATIEAIERAVCVSRQLQNSTGLALHTTLDGAKENAEIEAIERALCSRILSHHHRIFDLTLDVVAGDVEVKRIWDLFRSKGISVEWFLLGKYLDKSILMSVLIGDGQQAGVAVGFGGGRDVAQAAIKGVGESLRTFFWMNSERHNYSAEKTFGTIEDRYKVWTDSAKNVLATDYAYRKWFLDKIRASSSRSDGFGPLTVSRVRSELLTVPKEIGITLSLFACRAYDVEFY